MAIERIYRYRDLYLAVLAACNQLPEGIDGGTIYPISGDDLTADMVIPLNADRYPALEVFRCLHTAETDVLKARLANLVDGRTGGLLTEGGFVERQEVATQGAYLNSHVGRVVNVEIEASPGKWVKGTLETIEQVTRMSNGYPLALDTAKGIYAMDQGERQVWFVGLSARVYYLTLKRPKLPESLESLLSQLKEPIQAPDEDVSTMLELAVSMVLPSGGHLEGAASARLQRALQRFGMGQSGTPDAQVKVNAKMGVE